MTKNSPPHPQELSSMTHSEILKKFKRLSPLEPFGIIGFLCVAFLFIGCLFFFDYSSVSGGLRFHGLPWLKMGGFTPPSLPFDVHNLPGFLEEGGAGCDVFDGNWVWDESYPLYQSRNCTFIDEGFRCSENGRPDSFYTKWRWQPKDCKLPRFDAKIMLEMLRNKRIVFVGDSIGRNQWESLLCMLSSSIPDKDSIYEVGGRPITKHTGFLVFKFKDYNCTVEYYRAPFLVYQGRAPAGVSDKVKMTLKLDQMDWSSGLWRGADVMVFNTGHWWNNEKTVNMGCYFQEGEEVKMDMTVESAFRRSMETVVTWIGSQVNTNKTQVFFRTYAPVHFRGGDWKTGGSCHQETLPDLGALPVFSQFHFGIVADVLLKHMNESHQMKLDLLNVTNMSLRRKDGHASVYYLGPTDGPAPLHRQDCSHWCLPGIPDSWNELLYAVLLKKDSIRKQVSEEGFRNSTPVSVAS